MTKTQIRDYLKRIREDVRDIELVLKQAGTLTQGDIDFIADVANDASACAAQIVSDIRPETYDGVN